MELIAKTYLDSIRKICPQVSDTELDYFNSRLTLRELDKKDFFLRAGDVQNAMGFIVTGLTRSFFIDRDENEITVGFYPELNYATHYDAFLTRKPSRYHIQCLEPTIMVCLSFEDMQYMYQRSSTFEKYGRLIAEGILKAQQARIESFIFKTAEERYVDFIEHHPTLFNRISLSHLCSYLGIERQSLTRIRQKLAHK